MSLYPSYYGSAFWSGLWGGSVLAPEGTKAVEPEAKVEQEEPLDRSKALGVLAGLPQFASYCDGAPAPTLAQYRWMRWHQAVEFAFALVVNPIAAGTRTLVIREQDGSDSPPRKTMPGLPGVQVQDSPQDKRKKLAEDVFECLWPQILEGLEALNFGRWTQEVLWDRWMGVTAPVRFKSFLPWDVVLVKDKFNDLQGVKLGTEERDLRYVFHAVNNPHFDPVEGVPRLAAAYMSVLRYIKSHENADRIEQKASGRQMWIELANGKTTTGADGQPVFTKEEGEQVLNAAKAGQVVIGPMYAFTLAAMKANADLAKFPAMRINPIDWGDTGPSMKASIMRRAELAVEIVRAYHRPEREAMEGQKGTKAEAGVHGQVGITDSELVGQSLYSQFNVQTFNRYLATNYGPSAIDSMYWKMSPLADPQQTVLQDVVKALYASPTTGPMMEARTDLPGLLKRVEMVTKPENQVVEPPPLPTAQDAGAGQDGGGNGAPTNGNGGGNGRLKQMGLSAGPFDGAGALALADCGTGAGGFKHGNTCATGGGAAVKSIPQLSDDEKAAVKAYSLSGYQVLNQKLRDGEALTPKEQHTADLLDSAIEKAGVREEPVKVYRGVEVPRPPGPSVGLSEDDIRKQVADFAEKRYPVGKEITLGPNYQSASLDVQAPLDHSVSRTHPGIIFEIQARSGLDASKLSGFDDEDEFLMGRDRRFRVLGVTRSEEFVRPDDKTVRRTVVRLEELL